VREKNILTEKREAKGPGRAEKHKQIERETRRIASPRKVLNGLGESEGRVICV